MNTHDIELPPLPPLHIAPGVEPVDYPEVAQALMDYARTAVEAVLQSPEVQAWKRDASRYRWLRNRASTEGICVVHIDYWSEEYRGQAHCEVYDGEFLDKEIDASMEKQP